MDLKKPRGQQKARSKQNVMWDIWYETCRISNSDYLLSVDCVLDTVLAIWNTLMKKKQIKILAFMKHFGDGEQKDRKGNKHNKRILKKNHGSK